MKLLLSAYACDAGRGSEPGVGWHWAIELARRGHEVWVLTRADQRPANDAALTRLPEQPKPHFLYYELPRWVVWWRKESPGWTHHLHNLLWQWGAYRHAKRIHARERFEKVHHVTYGSVRAPSFMGNLGIPFIFGPAGGGERAPWRLRHGYTWRAWLWDILRDGSNLLVKIDPLMRRTFSQAAEIYVKTPQSRKLVPRQFMSKTRCELEIGVDLPHYNRVNALDKSKLSPARILYVGRFVSWKGMHLGIPAFAYLIKSYPNARLTLVGNGRDEASWRSLVNDLGVADHVDWVSWVPHSEMHALYAKHQVLLFPSLQDSSGNVVLEALAHGLPVVCLDLAGPGIIVDDSCGRVIKTTHLSKAQVIRSLGDALKELTTDSRAYHKLSQGALLRAQDFAWSKIVGKVWG